MANHYCIDQQIINWQYLTTSRYQLSEAPVTVTKYFLLSRSSSNTIGFPEFTFNCWNKEQKKNKFSNFSVFNWPWSSSAIFESGKLRNRQSGESSAKIYLNHPQLWGSLKKITLHTTSGKLLSHVELYASSYMAFCCCGIQSPQMIRSKQSIAGFNVIKTAIIGTRSSLRNKNKLYFSYKWAYLVAGLPFLRSSGQRLLKKKEIKPFQYCLGIQNVFTFPELDKYNYYLFEPIAGFDLSFHYKGYSGYNKVKKQK